MPTDRGLDLNKPDRQRIAEVGGFRELEGYLHLTTDTLVAFYIVLLIQTAANAGPLRQIKRDCLVPHPLERHRRSEEHTSELQSLMRNSYAVFCLKKKSKLQQNK